MSDTRPRVGVDLDGVLADFVSAFRNIARELFGTPTDLAPVLDWGFGSWGLTEAELRACFNRVHHINNFWALLAKMPNTSLLDRWFPILNRTYFITARKPTKGDPTELQSAKWLHQIFGIEHPTVIVAENKGPVALALELDYFIDDRPEICVEVKKYRPQAEVMLVDADYNKSFKSENIIRVAGFNDLAREIANKH